MTVHKKDTRENDLFGSQEHNLSPNLHLLEVEQGKQAESSMKYKQEPENAWITPQYLLPVGEFSVCLLHGNAYIASIKKSGTRKVCANMIVMGLKK